MGALPRRLLAMPFNGMPRPRLSVRLNRSSIRRCCARTRRALVSALVGAGRLDTACEVLDWMSDDGVAGNAVVYQVLINAFLERGQQAQVRPPFALWLLVSGACSLCCCACGSWC